MQYFVKNSRMWQKKSNILKASTGVDAWVNRKEDEDEDCRNKMKKYLPILIPNV